MSGTLMRDFVEYLGVSSVLLWLPLPGIYCFNGTVVTGQCGHGEASLQLFESVRDTRGGNASHCGRARRRLDVRGYELP